MCVCVRAYVRGEEDEKGCYLFIFRDLISAIIAVEGG